ncbi:PEPxxWA-CTERM sorting domain-containing protein [Sandarakinorhabdus sp.]|uniref:PEPxxWA-CTERM sorting domain-containing protein n=1 Tax=Sandarakinorhabdus sp. TaxID=1916663 RepID=UPI003F6EFE51
MNIIRLLTSALLLASASSASAVTLASFSPDPGTNVHYTRTSTSTGRMVSTNATSGTTPLWVSTQFTFGNSTFASILGTFAAEMLVDMSINDPAQEFFGTIVQPLQAGEIKFRTLSDLTVGQTFYAAGANLLSFDYFTGGGISGSGNTASLIANPGGGANFTTVTSDFLNFAAGSEFDLNMSLLNLTSALGFTANQPINSFSARAGGILSSDSLPGLTAVVPEPQSWAMFIIGFGIVGAVSRRHRRTTTVAS